MRCFIRDKCYSHVSKEGSRSRTQTRVSGGRAAGWPEPFRQGHLWGLRSLWRNTWLSGDNLKQNKSTSVGSSFLSSVPSSEMWSDKNVIILSLFKWDFKTPCSVVLLVDTGEHAEESSSSPCWVRVSWLMLVEAQGCCSSASLEIQRKRLYTEAWELLLLWWALEGKPEPSGGSSAVSVHFSSSKQDSACI